MIIGYEAKRIYHNHSGLGNYGRNLIRALAADNPDSEFRLYNPWPGSVSFPAPSNVIEQLPALKSKLYAQLWRRRFISKQAQREGVEIFHGLSAELPQGLSKLGIKSIVSIHDLIFLRYPELYKAIDRKIYKRKALAACQRADLVVAISHQTREDLIKLLGISPSKIKVIGQGCAPEFWEDHQDLGEALVKREALPERFGLFVGTLEPRKNPVALAQACLAENIPLVLVGRPKKYWVDFYNSLSAEEKKLIRPIKVGPNAELAGLYQKATFMAYPSNFEGFGIPLVEAMACNTALISSANSALKEVAGPGTLLVKENTPEQLGTAIRKFWEDEDLRQKSIKQNRNFVAQFKDQVIARQWMDTYRELAGHD